MVRVVLIDSAVWFDMDTGAVQCPPFQIIKILLYYLIISLSSIFTR